MTTILTTTQPHLKKLFSVFMIAFSSLLYTQSEGKIWYFGSNAGLDFNSNPPAVLNNGQINTLEGTASIADENGNLLFYTDGVKAYTKNHTLMPNGAGGLGGNSSSAQSALVVPHPGNSNQFFLFTVSEYPHSNLFYSVIDMSLNNGLGDVLANSKALTVLSNTGEYIQATPSADGNYWWLLTHKNGTADYYAFKVTASGVELNQPIISNSGTVSSALGDIGFIKFNNPGNRMVRTSYMQHYFEISDFNNATGQVTGSIQIPFHGAYGAEFSPNNRFLYISGYSNLGLKQFDLDAGNTTANLLGSAYTYSNQMNGALQIAPDGKIYSSRFGAASLDVIQEPNQHGAAANFQMNFQSLGSGTSQLGLPNFIINLVSQSAPKLEQLIVSNISDTEASLSVNINSDGGTTIIERGFYFGTDTTSFTNNTLVSGTVGQMVLQLENLLPETTYYFGAFATNQHGSTHLNWGTFTTLADIDIDPPVAICVNELYVTLDEFGFASITYQQIDNGSYDNVAIAQMFIDTTHFGCDNLGNNIVTLTVIDVSGNVSSCVTNVIVQDITSPEIDVEFGTNNFNTSENQPYLIPDYFAEGLAWAFDNCNEIVTGQFPAAGTVLEAGTHLITLQASDVSGNTAEYNFEISIETVLDTEDFTSGFDITIYPNPTTESINFSGPNLMKIETVAIYDLNGKLVQSIDQKEILDNTGVNVSHFAASTYLIVMKGEGTTSVKKLIKR